MYLPLLLNKKYALLTLLVLSPQQLELERSQKCLIEYWERVVKEFLTGTSSCKVHNLRKRRTGI